MMWLYNLFYAEKDKQIADLQLQIIGLTDKINQLTQTAKPKEPQVFGTLTFRECYDILTKLSSSVFVSDEWFSVTSKEEAKKFSDATKVQYRLWQKDNHDCDNFSFAAMGYWSDGLKSFPYGIAWSQNHAFNIFIDKDKQVWIVEPQTNAYMTIDEAKKKSTPDGLNYFPMRLVLM